MPDSLIIRSHQRRVWIMSIILTLALLIQPVWGLHAVAAHTNTTAIIPHSRSSVLPDWFIASGPGPAGVLTSPRLSPSIDPVRELPTEPYAQTASPSLSKTASVVTATLGQVFTYTLVFTIPAQTTLTNVRLDDNLPDNSPNSEPDIRRNGVNGNYTGPTAVTPGTPSIAPGDVVPCGTGDYYLCWQLPDIANSSGQPYVYRMTYQAYVYNGTLRNVRGEVGVNAATLSWTGGSAAAQASVTIVAPNIQVKRIITTSGGESAVSDTVDDDLFDLRAGEILTLTVLVTNTADSFVSPAYNLRVRDNLPPWIDYESSLSGPAPTSQSGDTQLEWLSTSRGGNIDALDVLDVGEVFAVTYRARVVEGVSPDHSDDRRANAQYYYLPPTSGDSRTIETGNIRFTTPDVSVIKTYTDPPPTGQAVVGEIITYTLDYTLPWGTTVYTPTYVEDQLDDGLRFMGVVAQPAEVINLTVDESGENDTLVRWYLTAPLTMTSDIRHTIIFTAQAEQYFFLGSNSGEAVPVGEWLNNRARLRWLNETGNTDDSGWSTDVEVRLIRPQINPVKTGDLSAANTPIRFELTVRNSTNTYADYAYNVVVSDTLPEGWTYVASQPAGLITTVGGRTVITWGVTPVLTPSWYLPGPSASATVYVVTATSPLTLVVGSPHTNTVQVSYENSQGYRYLGNYDHVMALDLAATKEATPSGQMPVGTPITYSLVTVVPPYSVLYWPRHQDTFPLGVRYDGWYAVSGGTLLTAPITGTSSNRETLTWWWNTLDNSASGTPLTATLAFRAIVSGIDINDAVLWTSNSDLRGAPNIRNRSVLDWNTENVSGVYPDSQNVNRPDGAEEVIQPFLVDPNYPFFKALMGAPPTVQSGDILTYNLGFYNTGRASAYDVVISDSLPFGVEFVSFSTDMFNPWSGALYTPTFSAAPAPGDTGTIGWVLDEINSSNNNPDQPTMFFMTYTVRVTDSVGAGATLVNSAWISDYTSLPGPDPYERHYTFLSGAGDPVSADSVPVSGAQFTKQASPALVAIGETVVFTLSVPDPALGATLYNVTVTDTMPTPAPAGPLHILTASAPGATVLNVTSDTLTANYAAIPAYTQATIVITARVPVTAVGGPVQNTAQMRWEDAPTGGNTHTAVSGPATVTILAPDVTVRKDAPAVAPPGSPLVYTLVYTNDGAAPASSATLTDVLPGNVTYQNFASDRPVTQTGFAPGPLVWELGTLAPAESGTLWITVTVNVAAPLGSNLVNTATIGTTSAGDDAADNQDTATTTVSGAVLQVAKIASPDPVQAGDPLVYTLVVTNTGNLATQNLVITDRVPLSTTFITAGSGGSEAGGVITWNPADIGVGQQAVVTFAVQVDMPLVSGTLIINDAYGASADNAPASTTTPVIVTVHSQPVLSIQKTAAGAANAGDPLIYTLVYRNTGNAVANNVRITESYDANIIFVGASPAPDVGNNIWLVGSLTPTASHTIVVTTQVNPAAQDGTFLTNTVTIAGEQTATQSDTAITRVGDYVVYMPIIVKGYTPLVPPPDMNLVVQAIQVSPATPTVGEATRITVTLHNSGTQIITDDFWVDLYIDPTTTPTIGVVWNDIAPFGKAWFIHDDIPGGGTWVIHTDQPDDSENPDDSYSNWPGWFVSPGDHVLYVQVDSYGLPGGLIEETDESDNVFGPTNISVSASSGLLVPLPSVEWQERR